MGVIGYLLGLLLTSQAKKYRQKIEAEMPRISTSLLRSKPNVVFEAAQLRSITLKSRNLGPLVPPDIILETKNGKKQKYGIQKPDFDKAMEQMKQLYPSLCKVV